MNVLTYALTFWLVIGAVIYALNVETELDRYRIVAIKFQQSLQLSDELYSLNGTQFEPSELQKVIDKQGIETWLKCKEELVKLDIADLPSRTRLEVKKCIEYCDVQMKFYRLIIYALGGESETVGQKIEEANRELLLIRDEINQLRGSYD